MNGILEKYIQKWKSKNPALEKFAEIGFPTKDNEAWKYTNIQSILEPVFAPYPPKGNQEVVEKKDYQIVFLNGLISKELSSPPEGVELHENMGFKKIPSTDDPFELLNLGLEPEALEIKLPKNFQSKKPLVIIHKVTGQAKDHLVCPRIKILASPFSKLSILETFEGEEGRYLTNALTEVILEEGAFIEHVKLVSEPMISFHIGKIRAICQKDSKFRSFTMSLGGKLTRNNLEIFLEKEGSEAFAHGVYALFKDQICDNFTFIEHKVPNTNSEQLFKGILDEESHGIFTGRILVFPQAQKITSQQLAKNLLLSKKAHVNARPILEINADDVKCTHGAAIGQMNPDEIFYLESRGIPKLKAQRLLCNAFAMEGINLIESTEIKSVITERFLEKLEKFEVGISNEKI